MSPMPAAQIEDGLTLRQSQQLDDALHFSLGTLRREEMIDAQVVLAEEGLVLRGLAHSCFLHPTPFLFTLSPGLSRLRAVHRSFRASQLTTEALA